MQDAAGKKCPKGELRCRAQLLWAKTMWLWCIREWKASGKERLDDPRICNRNWTLPSRLLFGIRALTIALTLRVKCLLLTGAGIVQTGMFCFKCSLGRLRQDPNRDGTVPCPFLRLGETNTSAGAGFSGECGFYGPIPCRSQSGNKYWWLYPDGKVKISYVNVHL